MREILPRLTKPVLTYGMSEDVELRAVNVAALGAKMKFTAVGRRDRSVLDVELNLVGTHNVLNALSAIAIAREIGIADEPIAKALASFSGVGRRFQRYGDIAIEGGGTFTLIDDYGHHPAEMAAVLNAARGAFPDRRIVLAFQPHRYTRTRDLFEDFAITLSQVDVLLLLEVYAAGETPIANADGRTLCRAIRARGHVDPIFIEYLDSLGPALYDLIHDNDVVLTLGAGDIGTASAKLVGQLTGVAP